MDHPTERSAPRGSHSQIHHAGELRLTQGPGRTSGTAKRPAPGTIGLRGAVPGVCCRPRVGYGRFRAITIRWT